MNDFLEACGLTEYLRLSVTYPARQSSDVHILHQPYSILGRDQRADLRLNHRQVSRRHVYVQVIQGRIFWIDLESRGGTLGGGRARKFGWLEAGEPIRIGPYEVRQVRDEGADQSSGGRDSNPETIPLIARGYGSTLLPEVSLEFLNGPSRSAVWPMNRVMSLVGSAGGCKFRLADPSVSPFHCSLVRTTHGVWAVDLLSDHGISVNDAIVRHARLNDNDVLSVGRYRIRVRARRSISKTPRQETRLTLLPDSPALHPVQRDALELPAPRPAANAPAGLPAPVNYRVLSAVPAEDRALPVAWPNPAHAPDTSLMAPDQARVVESYLSPLLDQFGLMQQQMMDQFQQAMSMLVQVFGTMHRDQMDLIRQELDQLREVTKEFHTLKAELALHAQNQSRSLQDQPALQAGDEKRAPAAPAAPETRASAAPVAREEDPATPSLSAPPLRRPEVAPGPVKAAGPEPRTIREPASSHAARAAAQTSMAGGLSEGRSETGRESAARPRPENERDSLVWLHQRIATLQDERESRWQRILKLLPGLS